MSRSSENRLTPLMDLVRVADRERYIAALYAPEEKRGDLLALYAFNAEIAGVRGRTRQPLTGEIRLQWWRDVIASGNVEAGAGNPVAEALLTAIERHELPREAFQNYLEARVFDLYDDPMPSRDDLEGYCGETASTLVQLSAMMLDRTAATQVAELSGHAGCAQALTDLIRRLPEHRRRGQCYVPVDILTAAGTTRDSFVAADDDANAVRAVAAMMALACEHLSIFEQGAGELPPVLRPAFLPLAATAAQLRAMLGRERIILSRSIDVSAWRKHWAMFRRATWGWA